MILYQRLLEVLKQLFCEPTIGTGLKTLTFERETNCRYPIKKPTK